MGFSQNARLRVKRPESSEETPPGFSFAGEIAKILEASGYVVGEPDNWRDSGRSFRASRDGAELEVILSRIETDDWVLQLGPGHGTGLLAKILGRSPQRRTRTAMSGRKWSITS